MVRVELAVRMGLTSEDEACTSKLCKWKDMSRKQVEPSRLSMINFSRPKRGQTELTPKLSKVPKSDVQGTGINFYFILLISINDHF